VRLREVLSEALANVRTGVSRAPLSIAFALLLIAALVATDGWEVADLEARAQTFQASGGAVHIMSAPGMVNGSACDRLASLSGVEAAGAVRKNEVTVRPLALPRQQIPSYSVSPGFGGFRAMPGFAPGAGVAVSTDLADILGLRKGDQFKLAGGSANVSSVFAWPDDGRAGDFGYAVIAATGDAEPFDQCWVALAPGAPDYRDVQSAAISAAAPSGDASQPKFSQLNSAYGIRSISESDFEDRPGRFAPLLAFVLAGIFAAGLTRLRRIEIAGARHVGVSARAVSGIFILETGLATIVAVAAVAAIVAVLTHFLDAAILQSWWRISVAVFLGGCGGTVSSVLSVSENDLFRLFKGR